MASVSIEVMGIHGLLSNSGYFLCTMAPRTNVINRTKVIKWNHVLLVGYSEALFESFSLEKPWAIILNISFPLYRTNEERITWIPGTMICVSTGCPPYFYSPLNTVVIWRNMPSLSLLFIPNVSISYALILLIFILSFKYKTSTSACFVFKRWL